MKATRRTRRFVLPTKPQTCGTALELRGPVACGLDRAQLAHHDPVGAPALTGLPRSLSAVALARMNERLCSPNAVTRKAWQRCHLFQRTLPPTSTSPNAGASGCRLFSIEVLPQPMAAAPAMTTASWPIKQTASAKPASEDGFVGVCMARALSFGEWWPECLRSNRPSVTWRTTALALRLPSLARNRVTWVRPELVAEPSGREAAPRLCFRARHSERPFAAAAARADTEKTRRGTSRSSTSRTASTATGLLLAGVYPVGMKIMVGWGVRDRSLLVGLFVAALTASAPGQNLPERRWS